MSDLACRQVMTWLRGSPPRQAPHITTMAALLDAAKRHYQSIDAPLPGARIGEHPYSALGRPIMPTPLRPQLAATLGVLTGLPVEEWHPKRQEVAGVSDNCVVFRHGEKGETRCYPWIYTTVAEAWEALQAHDIIPLHYEGCFADAEGVFIIDSLSPECGGASGWHPPTTSPLPASLPDLIAWTSLGAVQIATAEDLARERELAPGNLVAWMARSWSPPRGYLAWETAEKALAAMGTPVDYHDERFSLLTVPPLP